MAYSISLFRTLVPLEFKQLCTKMPTASAEDSEEIKAKIHEELEERARKQQQRSSLVIGLNQVIRALEKGTLRLVLVSVVKNRVRDCVVLEYIHTPPPHHRRCFDLHPFPTPPEIPIYLHTFL